MKGKWSAVNRVARGKGMLKGCWLVDPDGAKVATIMDGAIRGSDCGRPEPDHSKTADRLSRRSGWVWEGDRLDNADAGAQRRD